MEINSVFDSSFAKYGRVHRQYDFRELIKAMDATPLPADVAYVPSVPELEAVEPAYTLLRDNFFGGLPIQIGYCNGNNYALNAVEYHRSSELNIAVTDLVVMVGWQQDIYADAKYDTSKIELFRVPAGIAVEFYATTLHYAPCNDGPNGFKDIVVLPKDTNTPIIADLPKTGEYRLMTARNKWLIAHKDAGIAGAVVGLVGENITIPH